MEMTPGPWRLVPGNHEGHWYIVAGDYADEGEPDLWAEVCSPYPADARAMAAAPELLAACEAALGFFSAEPGTVLYTADTWLALRNRLHVAVARARGGTEGARA